MGKISDKLGKLNALHGVIVLQMCTLVAVMLFWSPWDSSVTTSDATSASTVITKSAESTDQAPETISATETNLTTFGEADITLAAAKTTKTKLVSLSAAENQTYTKSNRLFVTGGGGIFEIVPSANGSATAVQRMAKQKCEFGGIVEALGTLYVNCNAPGKSQLYAAKLTAEPTFTLVRTFQGTILANGLTADSAGRLYVASTFVGRILRLTPSATDPLTFTKGEVWHYNAGLLTNGIKFANNSIYWTEGAIVKRVAIKADGKPGSTKILFGAIAYFDDLAVDSNGILVADFIGNAIRSYTTSGRATGTIRANLSGPSSVARAKSPFPTGSLIVTERSGNQVSLVTP